MQDQITYTQKDIVSEIHRRTKIPSNEITAVLNSLGDVVKQTLCVTKRGAEIRIFPGLKITAEYLSPAQSKSNLTLSQLDFVLRLHAGFSDYFRKEVRNLHQLHVKTSQSD